MKRRVVAALEDLLFRSKIHETAESLENIEAAFPRSPKKLMESIRESPPDLLVLDLNSSRFEPLRILEEINSDETMKAIPTVGFLSHVQKDLAVAAKEFGCGRVMARSAFTQKLPEVLAGKRSKATTLADKRWTKLSSEKLVETPYFTLRTDELRLPDGAVKDSYYILERPDAAFIFPLTKSGEVVLVRQYRPPLEQMELCLPAGLIESGEDVIEAAKRELLEETGHGGGEWEKVITLSSSPGLKNNWAHIYLAKNVEEISTLDPDEFERLEVVKVPLEKMKDLVYSGEIVSSSGVAGIMICMERLAN